MKGRDGDFDFDGKIVTELQLKIQSWNIGVRSCSRHDFKRDCMNTLMTTWTAKIGDFLDQFTSYQLSETPCTEDLEQHSYLQTIKVCFVES